MVLLNHSRGTDFSVAVKVKLGGKKQGCDWCELLCEISDGIAIRPGLVSTVWGQMTMFSLRLSEGLPG